MEKLKISRAIIVEGKYDKIKLSSIVDGVIIVTNGFRIYKDHDKAALIRYYAQHGGELAGLRNHAFRWRDGA